MEVVWKVLQPHDIFVSCTKLEQRCYLLNPSNANPLATVLSFSPGAPHTSHTTHPHHACAVSRAPLLPILSPSGSYLLDVPVATGGCCRL